MLPDFPICKKLIKKELVAFFMSKIEEYQSVGVLKNAIRRIVYEGDHLETHYSPEFVYGRKMKAYESGSTIDREILIKDPYQIFNLLDTAAKEIAEESGKEVLNMVDEITKITGNVEARVGEFTVHHFLDMLKKIQIEFKEDGTPNIPILYCSPHNVEKFDLELKRIDNEIEIKNLFNKIIEQKKQEWNEREANRKQVD